MLLSFLMIITCIANFFLLCCFHPQVLFLYFLQIFFCLLWFSIEVRLVDTMVQTSNRSQSFYTNKIFSIFYSHHHIFRWKIVVLVFKTYLRHIYNIILSLCNSYTFYSIDKNKVLYINEYCTFFKVLYW